MTDERNIILALCLPAIAFVCIWLFGKRPNIREAFHLGAALNLLLVVSALAASVFRGARPEFVIYEPIVGELSAAFQIGFRVEPLGATFALVASSLWILTTVYAIGYMRGHHEQHQTRFFSCFAIAILAAMGAAMAKNLFTLFIFYELMTLSTYPLVTHHGTEAARQGGRTYMGILLFTSIAFLMFAIGWTWNIAGNVDFAPGGILRSAYEQQRISSVQLGLLLALFAFGTGKAALMPFHRWLPSAMVAPTPVSALLHAVAVVKVGVFTILKVVVYIFGLDLLQETGSSVWLMYAASFTILAASIIAMTKDNLKARLAYSTVSQLSYIILGAALANPSSILGGGMHIVMHAVGKITLFFCAGAIYVGAHKTKISEMGGLGWKMPFTMIAFLIGSISIIGLPPTGGTWSKWFLCLGTFESEHPWLIGVLLVSSLLNVAYLLPIPIRGFLPAGSAKSTQPISTDSPLWDIKEAPVLCVVPLCLTAVGSMILFFAADPIFEFLQPITKLP